MSNIVITGALGQLGEELTRTLASQNPPHVLMPTDVRPLGLPPMPRGIRCLDITSHNDTLGFIEKHNPSIIVNCAAFTDVDGAEINKDVAHRVNADGPAHLAEAAATVDALLIHISTDFVFDGMGGAPYSEASATNPLSVYGASKLAGEQRIAKIWHRHLIIRTSWLCGVGDGNIVAALDNNIRTSEDIWGIIDEATCPTFTFDLADAIAKMINGFASNFIGTNHYGTYHFCGADSSSAFGLATMMNSLTDRGRNKTHEITAAEWKVKYGPEHRATRPHDSSMSCQKIEGLDLDIVSPPFAASLEEWQRRRATKTYNPPV